KLGGSVNLRQCLNRDGLGCIQGVAGTATRSTGLSSFSGGCPIPRWYCHIHSSEKAILDAKGIERPDLAAIRKEALAAAGEN
ncbi:MAG: hypothetical protein M3145_12105, partial [Pseudomonadota bacterium]|nr:hypothetical protein [Pseudomonadota bacterium]